MKVPAIRYADDIVRDARTCSAGLPDGRWVAARPLPFDGGPLGNLPVRFKAAWLAFTGRADAVRWHGDQ